MTMLTNIYLDYNATVPPREEALAVHAEYAALPLNASSVHGFGRQAKQVLEASRRAIAERLSCFPAEIIFTASGSEANAMALQAAPERKLLVAATEHPSVLRQREDCIILPVDANGLLDMEVLEKKLQAHQGEGVLLSVMLANNETGVIQPIREIAAMARQYGAVIHCDAAQALGKMPVDVGLLGVDMLTISAHKCGATLGAAALIAREGVVPALLMRGGGQELRRRAGTENIAAIAAFAEAVKLAEHDDWQVNVRGWLDAMEKRLSQAGAIILGEEAPRLPNTSAIAMPDKSAEIQLVQFDLKSIAVSAGSACSSGRVEASHVAKAMLGDESELASQIIRVSAGWNTSEQDIAAFEEAWIAMKG